MIPALLIHRMHLFSSPIWILLKLMGKKLGIVVSLDRT